LLFVLRSTAQTFVEISPSFLFADSLVTKHSLWFDADNDTDLDLFITNIYNRKNELHINTAQKLFSFDSTSIAREGGNSYGAIVADVDHDRDLDLFVYNIFGQKNYFYINKGNNQFDKKIFTPVNSSDNNCFSASFCDYDNDGDQDLIITDTELWNKQGSKRKTQLFDNDGRGNFTVKTTNTFSNPHLNSRGAEWGDYNNDGLMDLFIANFGTENELYLNKGKGILQPASSVISAKPGDTNSASWGDVDNDGDLDLFVVNVKAANEFFINNGDGSFTKQERNEITENKNITGNVHWTDINNDGTLDLFGNSVENKANTLYLNQSNGNKWIKIKLRGDGSNVYGVGARVKIKANINGKSVWQIREVQSKPGRPQINQYDIHFGLNKAPVIDSIQLIWPSGTVQTLTGIMPDQLIVIEEAKKYYPIIYTQLNKNSETLLRDVSIRMISDTARIGQVNSITIFYENKGIVSEDVTIKVEMNLNFECKSSFPAYSKRDGHTYEWTIKNVKAGSKGIITTAFQVRNDPYIFRTEQLIKAWIYPIAFDENKSDNTLMELKAIY
jgi:enediyne biosynthesis protein E4